MAFFTEFASPDPLRRGIAISRLAECFEELKRSLDDVSLKAVMKEEILKKAVAELQALTSALAILNGGKRESTSVGLWNLNSSAQSKDRAEVEAAANTLYEFLQTEASPLRGFLAILSAGGIFYSAFSCEKTARAAICSAGGNISKKAFVEAAVARLAGAGTEKSENCGSRQADVDNLLRSAGA